MKNRPLREAFRNLSNEIDRTFVLPKGTRGLFKICSAAALIKLVDFNVAVNRPRKTRDHLFQMSALRGFCDDLITITYLLRQPPNLRDSIVEALVSRQTEEDIRSQTAFFAEYRSDQWIIVRPPSESQKRISDIRSKIAAINGQLGKTPSGRLPTVEHMANECGLTHLYSFLYRGTSKIVHFNPRHLLRMGWGDTDTRQFVLAAGNFDAYYIDFTRFYAALIFSEYMKATCHYLRPGRVVRAQARLVEHFLHKCGRWPELVTFEEMNIDPRKFPNFMHIAIGMEMAYGELKQGQSSD